ncbi:MAG: DUF4372 domain-containing protein [Sphingobacteriales bacterium]|nr:DUF4372 domain-containing protein [Sphingobacteriales bacterium]
MISLIPNFIFDGSVNKYNSNRYIKRFTTIEHIVTMLFCVGSNSTSLRFLLQGLQNLISMYLNLLKVHLIYRNI